MNSDFRVSNLVVCLALAEFGLLCQVIAHGLPYGGLYFVTTLLSTARPHLGVPTLGGRVGLHPRVFSGVYTRKIGIKLLFLTLDCGRLLDSVRRHSVIN